MVPTLCVDPTGTNCTFRVLVQKVTVCLKPADDNFWQWATLSYLLTSYEWDRNLVTTSLTLYYGYFVVNCFRSIRGAGWVSTWLHFIPKLMFIKSLFPCCDSSMKFWEIHLRFPSNHTNCIFFNINSPKEGKLAHCSISTVIFIWHNIIWHLSRMCIKPYYK